MPHGGRGRHSLVVAGAGLSVRRLQLEDGGLQRVLLVVVLCSMPMGAAKAGQAAASVSNSSELLQVTLLSRQSSRTHLINSDEVFVGAGSCPAAEAACAADPHCEAFGVRVA